MGPDPEVLRASPGEGCCASVVRGGRQQPGTVQFLLQPMLAELPPFTPPCLLAAGCARGSGLSSGGASPRSADSASRCGADGLAESDGVSRLTDVVGRALTRRAWQGVIKLGPRSSGPGQAPAAFGALGGVRLRSASMTAPPRFTRLFALISNPNEPEFPPPSPFWYATCRRRWAAQRTSPRRTRRPSMGRPRRELPLWPYSWRL